MEEEVSREGEGSLLYPSLSREDVLDVIRLIRSDNVGAVTFFNLVRYYGSVSSALEAVSDGGCVRSISLCSREDAEREYEAVCEFGAKFILYGDEAYPFSLANIHDAPPLITVLGREEILSSINAGEVEALAVVGSRNASANACRFAYKVSADLADAGCVVVSGLARGVDSYAHRGALSSGDNSTIAVIAGGIDNIYPPRNVDLYHMIAERGLIVSEMGFGVVPQNGYFPRRNRIISGLSKGVVVIEASRRSGSIITADMALEQGREVFAVPGSPLDSRCGGNNYLLKQGAQLVESAADVISSLGRPSSHDDLFTRQPVAADDEDNAIAVSSPTIPADDELGRVRLELVEKLGASPVLVDELIEECRASATSLNIVLVEMELAGRLQRHDGDMVSVVIDDETSSAR